MPEEKYTLVESFFIFLFGGIIGSGAIVLITIAMLPLLLLSAWIRWILWQWFAVPFLHLPMLSYWAVVGLCLLIHTFSHTDQPNGYKPTNADTFGRIFGAIAVEFIALGIGYIIHIHI
jgi:hypothetical protein